MLLPIPQLRAVTASEGAVVINFESDTRSTLNSSGAFVWERIQNRIPMDQIVTELALHAGIPHTQASTDISEFLEQLCAIGLLRESL